MAVFHYFFNILPSVFSRCYIVNTLRILHLHVDLIGFKTLGINRTVFPSACKLNLAPGGGKQAPYQRKNINQS